MNLKVMMQTMKKKRLQRIKLLKKLLMIAKSVSNAINLSLCVHSTLGLALTATIATLRTAFLVTNVSVVAMRSLLTLQ